MGKDIDKKYFACREQSLQIENWNIKGKVNQVFLPPVLTLKK